MDIFERKEGTINALFSPRLWTEDGLASLAGDKTFWDRSTLYGLRGVFAAGETEKAFRFLKYYSQRRLLGEHVPYAVEAFPEGQQAGIYNDLFAQPAIAQELINSTGTRSVDVWNSAAFRQQAARMFASMSEGNRQTFIHSLAEETGLHFTPKPLAEPAQPQLQPTDPEKDIARAKARLAMLDAVAPQATTPTTKTAVTESRTAIQEEIAASAELRPKRISPVNLPIPDPFGAPAGVIDQQAQAGPGAQPAPPAAPNGPGQ